MRVIVLTIRDWFTTNDSCLGSDGWRLNTTANTTTKGTKTFADIRHVINLQAGPCTRQMHYTDRSGQGYSPITTAATTETGCCVRLSADTPSPLAHFKVCCDSLLNVSTLCTSVFNFIWKAIPCCHPEEGWITKCEGEVLRCNMVLAY